MPSPRSHLIELIAQGAIPAEKIGDALAAVKVLPTGQRWRTFIDHLLLWLGGLSLAVAVMFFIVYNWNFIGHFAKFGMVEGVIVLAMVAYCSLCEHTTASNVSLLVATIFLGVLLALYGQTYQTGADPWQLFFSWALLMLPWALVGRFPALWIVWVALINIAIVLYYQTFRSVFWFMSDLNGMLWLVFFFNTLVLAAWEFLSGSRPWLSERWAIRIIATGSGVSITGLVLSAIFNRSGDGKFSGLVWLVWLIMMYIVYRKVKSDLFMLAAGCLSGITVSVSFLGEQMLKDGSPGGFLFLALVVIGMGAGAAFWLKNVHQECQS